jgi:hypothetical protein
MLRASRVSSIEWRSLVIVPRVPSPKFAHALVRLAARQQTRQHSDSYALGRFWGLAESGEDLEKDEWRDGKWMTLETEDGQAQAQVRLSGPRVHLENHLVPARLEIKTGGAGEPEIYARVEVDENRSKLAELHFTSTDPDARGIRQSDLREVEVRALVEDFVAMFTLGYGVFPYASKHGGETVGLEIYGVELIEGGMDPSFLSLAQSLRHGRKRDITPALLEKVAEIYRANIHGAPTKAVEHHFQVSQRMAVEYVSRARKAGLLPPTVRGRKKA